MDSSSATTNNPNATGLIVFLLLQYGITRHCALPGNALGPLRHPNIGIVLRSILHGPIISDPTFASPTPTPLKTPSIFFCQRQNSAFITPVQYGEGR
jgi:hypothetical protein